MTKDLLALMPGLRVSARVAAASNNQISGGGNSVVAPDGTFQVDGLRPGRVSIDVYASTPTFTRPSIARIEHDGIGISQGFDIQQSVSGLRVVINYGTGAIRGTVRLEGGASDADYRMYVNCKREGARDGTGASRCARSFPDQEPGNGQLRGDTSVEQRSDATTASDSPAEANGQRHERYRI